MCARPGAFGVDHEHVGVLGHQVDQQLHLVDQHRRQRLHPLDGDAGRDLVGQLDQLWVLLTQLGRTPANLVGEQQLATRRCPEPIDGLEGPLVGDGEAADLVHVVAPELHAERVLLRRREDVDDAAADCELTALLDQVDARVRRVREPAYDVLERSRVARRELDRREVAEPLDLRLKDRPDRGDHDPERPVGGAGPGVPAGVGGPPVGGPRCRCGGSAVRAEASPSSGSSRPHPGPPGRRAPRPGPRPRGPSGSPPAPCARRRPGPRRGTAAAPRARSGRARRGRRIVRPRRRRPGWGRRGRRRPVRSGATVSPRGAQHDGPRPGSAGGPGQFTAHV